MIEKNNVLTEQNSMMDFWFIDCMFCITIQRERKNIGQKVCKIQETISKTLIKKRNDNEKNKKRPKKMHNMRW